MNKYKCVANCPELDERKEDHCIFSESHLSYAREFDEEICPCGNKESLELIKDEI